MTEDHCLGRTAVGQPGSTLQAWQTQPAGSGFYHGQTFQDYNYITPSVEPVSENHITSYQVAQNSSHPKHTSDLYGDHTQVCTTVSRDQNEFEWQNVSTASTAGASEALSLTSCNSQVTVALSSSGSRSSSKEVIRAADFIESTSMHATPYLARDTCSKLMQTPMLAQEYQADFGSDSYPRDERSADLIALAQHQNIAGHFDTDSVISHRETSHNQFLPSSEANHLNANSRGDNIENSAQQTSRQPIATPLARQDHTYEQHGASGLSYPTPTATSYSNYDSQQDLSQSYYAQSVARVPKIAPTNFCYTDNKQLCKEAAINGAVHSSSSSDKFAPTAMLTQSSHQYEPIRSTLEVRSDQSDNNWLMTSQANEMTTSSAVNLNKQQFLDLTPALGFKSDRSDLTTKYQVYQVNSTAETSGQYINGQSGSNIGGLNLSHSQIDGHVAYQSSFVSPATQFSVSH